jgi:hypothetical protein
MFWVFFWNLVSINLNKITFFCYLNHIFECISEFSVVKISETLSLYKLGHSNKQDSTISQQFQIKF